VKISLWVAKPSVRCRLLLHDMSLSNISCLGGDYGTALQAAAARGYTDVVKCLLNSGSDPNVEGWCFIITGERMSNNYD